MQAHPHMQPASMAYVRLRCAAERGAHCAVGARVRAAALGTHMRSSGHLIASGASSLHRERVSR